MLYRKVIKPCATICPILLAIAVFAGLLLISIFAPYIRAPKFVAPPPTTFFNTRRASFGDYVQSEFWKTMTVYASRFNALHLLKEVLHQQDELPSSSISTSLVVQLSTNDTPVNITKFLNVTYTPRFAEHLLGSQFMTAESMGQPVTREIRIYAPVTVDNRTNFPVLLWFHGGGWLLNDLNRYDNVLTKLSASGPFVVVAVNYRKSPIFPFPAGLNDGVQAVLWAQEKAQNFGGNTSCIALGGDDSGGNIATAIAAYFDTVSPRSLVSHLVLVNPLLHNILANTTRFASYVNIGCCSYWMDYYVLSLYWRLYVAKLSPGQQANTTYLNLMAPNSTIYERLPATTVITAQYSPLVDENVAFFEHISNTSRGHLHQLLNIPLAFHSFLDNGKDQRSRDLAIQLISRRLGTQ